jgi:hypothetical protein
MHLLAAAECVVTSCVFVDESSSYYTNSLGKARCHEHEVTNLLLSNLLLSNLLLYIETAMHERQLARRGEEGRIMTRHGS